MIDSTDQKAKEGKRDQRARNRGISNLEAVGSWKPSGKGGGGSPGALGGEWRCGWPCSGEQRPGGGGAPSAASAAGSRADGSRGK